MFFFSPEGWNLPTHETKLMTLRIRTDLTSVTEVLCLRPPKVPEKSLCPKPDSKLLRNSYLAAPSLRLKDFSLLLKQYFRFRALQLVELQPLWKEWMRGHKYAPAVETWLRALERESLFPLTGCQKPFSCQNTPDEFTNSRFTFPHICGQVINCNHPAKG